MKYLILGQLLTVVLTIILYRYTEYTRDKRSTAPAILLMSFIPLMGQVVLGITITSVIFTNENLRKIATRVMLGGSGD